MPNHVFNIITASPEVIKSLLNSEGEIDFREVVPYPSEDLLLGETEGVFLSAEFMAQNIYCDRTGYTKSPCELSEDEFSQLIKFITNKYNHGFFHEMDFNKQKWGTKWNAYFSSAEKDSTEARFKTAWNSPFPVIHALSLKFPDEEIHVKYADEDLGSNCGEYIIKNGESVVKFQPAGRWDTMKKEEKIEAITFGCTVWEYSVEETLEDYRDCIE